MLYLADDFGEHRLDIYSLDPETRPRVFPKRNEVAIKRRPVTRPWIVQPALRCERLRIWEHLLIIVNIDYRH